MILNRAFGILRFVRQLPGVLLFLAISSCAVSVHKSQQLPPTLGTLSLQFGTISPDVARVRLAYLESRLAGELQARGYVLAQKNTTVPDSRAQGVYGLRLHVLSYSRNNALAGYYNSLGLALEVLDAEGSSLLRIEDSISQRGGLLLNAGQLLRGLTSSVDNLDETQQFEKLADKLLQRLARELPLPATRAALAAFTPQLGEVTINPLRDGIISLCITAGGQAPAQPVVADSAPSELRAVLVLGALRSPLSVQRLDTPMALQQRLCGNFPVSVLIKDLQKNFLELSDGYGRSLKLPIPQLEQLACSAQPKFEKTAPSSVLLSFAQRAAGTSQNTCTQAKVLVFRQQLSSQPALPASFTHDRQLELDQLEKQPLSLGLNATNEQYGIIIKDRYGTTHLPVYTK